ncbi:hypothetical protein ABK040_001196 [Willaertia magna]
MSEDKNKKVDMESGSHMKAIMEDTKDDPNFYGGNIEAETKAPYRDPIRGAAQTRIAHMKYPWDLVVRAYEQRFPKNPTFFPYINNTEILEKKETETTKYEVRRVSIDPGMPGWLKSLTRIHDFVFVEKSTIDWKNKKMTLYTENETLSTYAHVSEDCTYQQHPDNPNWTYKEQTAYYKLKVRLFGIEGRIEQYGGYMFIERARDALLQEKKQVEALKESERLQKQQK